MALEEYLVSFEAISKKGLGLKMAINGKPYHKAHFVGGPLDGQELEVPVGDVIEVEEHRTLDLKGRLRNPNPSQQKIHKYRLMYGYYQYNGYRMGYLK